jgi:hypothetical protein
MKTLKIFALLCFILAFTTKANAQTVVTKEVQSDAEFGIDCVNEYAIGTINFHQMLHFDKEGILIRYQQLVTGEFTGDSGTIYSLKGIWQDNNHIVFVDGKWVTDNTDNSQIIYRLRGESGFYKGVNIKFHGLWHLAIKPNGDVASIFWKPTLKCDGI